MHTGDELELGLAEVGRDMRMSQRRTEVSRVWSHGQRPVRPHPQALLLDPTAETRKDRGWKGIESRLQAAHGVHSFMGANRREQYQPGDRRARLHFYTRCAGCVLRKINEPFRPSHGRCVPDRVTGAVRLPAVDARWLRGDGCRKCEGGSGRVDEARTSYCGGRIEEAKRTLEVIGRPWEVALGEARDICRVGLDRRAVTGAS